MKPIIPFLSAFLLLAGGCKQDSGRKNAAPAPQTAEEYTQVIIKEVQKVILSTDQQLREYEPRHLEMPAKEEGEPRTLRLWAEAGNPVKLTATEPGGNGFIAFYFANGELFYAARPDAGFIFIGQELKYWLDEGWQPAQAPEEERREQERLLLKQARAYLTLFEE
ncbi:MAG: hypothetical protein KDD10_16585 [Phaeodactylibacter sp.]|nr:hypothetical protein [Phaeodactylibacter sp.]MCB9294224.1 hypothetical protein [Lewinellaceae bacterium]